MAYSNDGAYLAVIDEKKAATAFTVADGYSVNINLLCTFYRGLLNILCLQQFCMN